MRVPVLRKRMKPWRGMGQRNAWFKLVLKCSGHSQVWILLQSDMIKCYFMKYSQSFALLWVHVVPHWHTRTCNSDFPQGIGPSIQRSPCTGKKMKIFSLLVQESCGRPNHDSHGEQGHGAQQHEDPKYCRIAPSPPNKKAHVFGSTITPRRANTFLLCKRSRILVFSPYLKLSKLKRCWRVSI